MDIFSPIDNSLVGTVPQMSVKEVNASIEAAFAAQKDWGKSPIYKRVELLKKVAQLLEKQKEDFVKTLVLEVGKPKIEAENEVERTVDLIDYYAEEGGRIKGEVLEGSAYPNYPKKKLAQVTRVPLGVVLAITPFNYPLNEAAPKLVSALVVGNSCVFKPSTQGAVVGVKLSQLFEEAGVPNNVLKVITGKTEDLGDFLVSHPKIAAINFTGSYKTAEHLSKIAGIKKLVLGLSGKDVAIVLSDCDLEQAVSEIALGAFSFAGQRCTAIKRVLVEEEIADQFLDKFTREVEKKFILGDPRDEKITLGPVINDEAADLISQLIEDAKAKGAIVITDGKRDGRYIAATVLDYVNEEMRIAQEEIFGPVLSITRVKDEEEAVSLTNKSEYGLQASVWTLNLNKAYEMSEKIETGTVQINGMDARAPDNFPFTGFKHSGLGMVGGAKYLIEEMTRIKTIVLNLP